VTLSISVNPNVCGQNYPSVLEQEHASMAAQKRARETAETQLDGEADSAQNQGIPL
jgi:hypothetical protein